MPFEPGVRMELLEGKVREGVQVFHLDQVGVSRIVAKTVLAGALMRIVLPVVRIMVEVGWFEVAVGAVRGFAGIVGSAFRLVGGGRRSKRWEVVIVI